MVKLIRAAKIAASVVALAIVSVMSVPLIAKAAPATKYPTTIVVQSTPLAPTRCKAVSGLRSIRYNVDVVNQSDRGVLKYAVRWMAYDNSGNVVRQNDVYYYFDTALAPGHTFHAPDASRATSMADTNVYGALAPSVTRLTCSMLYVEFVRGKYWKPGGPW